MKKKLVEETAPVKAKKSGWQVTAQKVKDILVLNVFNNKILYSRHCINVNSYEYATLMKEEWRISTYTQAIGLDTSGGYYTYSTVKQKERFRVSKEDEELILRELKAEEVAVYERNVVDIVRYRELERGRAIRERTEQNRVQKVNEMMNKIPVLPVGIKEWINQRAIGGEDYATKTDRKGIFACSKCGEKFSESKLKRADGEKKVRHNDIVICPSCGKEIKLIKRKKAVDIFPHFSIVQPIDDETSVMRHFDAEIWCSGGRKQIGLDESIRIVMFKNNPKAKCSIYYNQYGRGRNWTPEGTKDFEAFDNRSNRANRTEYIGYLYDDGIEEAFKGTAYEKWTRLFKEFSAAGMELNYNRMMCASEGNAYIDTVEMIYRGRFYKLLRETSVQVSYWNMSYCGELKIYGDCIEDVFDIGDRQKINRIRDNDGGESMVEWMRWSERHKQKIPDKVLSWLVKNELTYSKMQWTETRMSLEQGMNYIERQKREQYKTMSIKQIINQYEDYMSMCQKLKKDTADEMVYRPRELKRRHDEAVEEIAIRAAEIKADEYSARFPGVEDIMSEIRERYEYKNDTYRIIIPRRCADIVKEGNSLHHCAGSSDRYFDRIKQRETYICFLRKNSEPDTPYYTIEVEPGGTIRQHRGYLDEEPEIEDVKPFLREWQKEIRKRMTEEDHKHAKISEVKRMENIKELQEKNNTRVLDGLMEDFMEAM